MTFASLLVLGIGLAMDATAVAAVLGMGTRRILLRHAMRVAASFGGAQALMAWLGWWLGAAIGPVVRAWDHWIAFALLSGLGAKMLWEGRKQDEHRYDQRTRAEATYGLRVMLVLSIATSIDSFAVGVTLPMLGAPFMLSLVTIGAITALLSVLGLLAGWRFGAAIGSRLEFAGGLVLIALGVKILVEHLTAS